MKLGLETSSFMLNTFKVETQIHLDLNDINGWDIINEKSRANQKLSLKEKNVAKPLFKWQFLIMFIYNDN